MQKLLNFIKVTIAGGILFLIPVVAIIFIVGRAFGLLQNIARPIAKALPFTRVAGVGVLTLISIILLLVVCFLAGIFMRTRMARTIIKWLEDRVLIYIPGYAYIHERSTEWLSNQRTSSWRPATVYIDDNEVLCFVIDEGEDYCSIFFPSAPVPSSGSVSARPKKFVTYLPISVSEAVLIIRQFGKGAAAVIDKVKPDRREEKE